MLRALATASCLMITFAISVSAQEADLKQKIETLSKVYTDAVARGDTATTDAMASPDLVLIRSFGIDSTPSDNREAIIEAHEAGIHLNQITQNVSPMAAGEAMAVTGTFTASYDRNPAAGEINGYWLYVWDNEGGNWKLRIATYTRAQPKPAGTTATSAQK